MEPLKDVLSRLDNKDKSTSQPASREDVISLLRTIDGDPEVEDFAMEGLNAAGPLFMVCVHLLVPLALMRNPEEFAEKARRTPQNASFKEDPSPRRMREFILNSITKRRRPTSGGSIWDSIDDQEEEQGEPARRRPSHSRRRAPTSTPLPSLWEDDDAGVADSETTKTRAIKPVCSCVPKKALQGHTSIQPGGVHAAGPTARAQQVEAASAACHLHANPKSKGCQENRKCICIELW